jgi:predicted deacylase
MRLGGIVAALVALLAWAPSPAARAEPLQVLGQTIAPGEVRRLALPVGESVGGDSSTPVIVVAGEKPGRVVCLTGGIHGDELNGVEVVRRSLERAKPAELRGTLIGVPIVNLAAFRRGSRYLPDRRDLNRFFPGHSKGSSAARLARRLFDDVVRHCELLVDVHSGSFHRTNLPQVRGDLRKPEVLKLARAFGSPLAIHNEGRPGTLRRAATDAGIPAIAYEAGEPMRFQEDAIGRGLAGVRQLLGALDMLPPASDALPAPSIYFRSRWVRAEEGGILAARAKLGDVVQPHQLLGTVFDPISNQRTKIRAPERGRVIGVAIDQLVMPGYAAFHIATDGGIERAGAPAAALPSVDEGTDGPRVELEERPD